MPDRIQTTLQQYFGFSDLRPGQQEVMQHLLEGRSAAAVVPTGGGKSLCYQLPALLLPGITLVISPLIALDGCQTNALAAHFGEQREEPCGHCNWCQQGKTGIPVRRTQPVSDDLWRKAEALRRKQTEILANPRQLTRFLCGVSSPRLSRSKLTGHALFGALEQIAFSDVLTRAEHPLIDP